MFLIFSPYLIGHRSARGRHLLEQGAQGEEDRGEDQAQQVSCKAPIYYFCFLLGIEHNSRLLAQCARRDPVWLALSIVLFPFFVERKRRLIYHVGLEDSRRGPFLGDGIDLSHEFFLD